MQKWYFTNKEIMPIGIEDIQIRMGVVDCFYKGVHIGFLLRDGDWKGGQWRFLSSYPLKSLKRSSINNVNIQDAKKEIKKIDMSALDHDLERGKVDPKWISSPQDRDLPAFGKRGII